MLKDPGKDLAVIESLPTLESNPVGQSTGISFMDPRGLRAMGAVQQSWQSPSTAGKELFILRSLKIKQKDMFMFRFATLFLLCLFLPTAVQAQADRNVFNVSKIMQKKGGKSAQIARKHRVRHTH